MTKKPEENTVIVADDELDLLEIISDTLEIEGYRVWRAKSGTELLHLAREVNPEVIISDIKMPEMDAIQVLDELGCEPGRNMPKIVLMTGHSKYPLRQAYERGIEAVFGKPFELDSLVNLLNSITGKDKLTSTRNSLRIQSEFYAEFRLGEGEYWEGKITNIGIGGFFLESESKIPVKSGDPVRIRIHSSSRNQGKKPSYLLTGSGTCRWISETDISGHGMGVSFEGFDHVSDTIIDWLNSKKTTQNSLL